MRGGLLISSAIDGSLLSWNVSAPGRPVARTPAEFWPTRTADRGNTSYGSAISPDGTLAVTTSAPTRPGHKGIQLWRATATGFEPAGPPTDGHTDYPISFAWSADGRTVFSGDLTGQVAWWDVSDPARPTLGGTLTQTGAVESILLSTDDNTLVVTGDDGTTIWDRTDRAHPRQAGRVATGLIGDLRSAVALTPDGRYYAVGHSVASLTVWDLNDPSHPRKIASFLTGRIGPVSAMAFSPDGRLLAVGGADGSVTLMNLAEPTNPHRVGQQFYGDEILVLAIAFLPDGHSLATQTTTHIDVWDMSHLNHLRADPATRACERLGGSGLDPNAWQTYAPTIDFENTCA